MAQQKPNVTKFELTDPKRIEKQEQLGAGNFGEVWKAKLLPANREGMEEMVAIRVLNNVGSNHKACAVTDVRTMTSLDHENIVKIKGISDGVKDNGEPQLCLIMELCNGGSLDKLAENDKLTESDKVRALLESAKGVAFLHKNKIIHRDIGSKSCFAHKTGDRVTFKIGDYGFMSFMHDHNYLKPPRRKLPIFSMPPESLQTREWSKSSDVWAFGILMMEIYNKGRNPYEHHVYTQKMETPIVTVVQFLNDGNRVDPPAGMPPELKEIVRNCTQAHRPGMDNRPGMDEIVGMLSDYFQKMK